METKDELPHSLGAYTFTGRSHEPGCCGYNGLPLTSNSVQILGRYQRFISFQNPFISNVLDIVRCERERMIVVTENFKDTLWKSRIDGLIENSCLEKLLSQSVQALYFLHSNKVTHRNLSLGNILLSPEGNIKFAQYEIYEGTSYGQMVNFFIGDIRHCSPEVLFAILSSKDERLTQSSYACDIWALAMIFLQLIMDYSPEFLNLLRSMLEVDSKLRPSSSDLLTSIVLSPHIMEKNEEDYFCYDIFRNFQRSKNLELCDDSSEGTTALEEINIRSMYILWKLTGGDLKDELVTAKVYPTTAAILALPTKVYITGSVPDKNVKDCNDVINTRIVELTMQSLIVRLQQIECYNIVLEEDGKTPNEKEDAETKVPLLIREHDIEYQFHRLQLFKRLLQSYPHTSVAIWKECRYDIPPMYRGVIWACLLNVKGDVYDDYARINKQTVTTTDRQIDVDIPRCHQYCNLLSSDVGHSKLRRVIKSWISSHPHYVYWQGLDSLCAPFLYLNFNDEAIAFASMRLFIDKYLKSFFLKDNSEVIQEYLAVFSQLITFHDPMLSLHMHEIEFSPDVSLKLGSHPLSSKHMYIYMQFHGSSQYIFPIDRILHLWDTLLLGTSSFPLFIGVAILQQLRNRLINSDFNECILLFSDLPEINIDECLADSIKIFKSTPSSATYRKCEADRPTSIDVDSVVDQRSEVDAKSANSISLLETKDALCPRICITDLLNMNRTESRVIVIDCRNADTYLKGTFAGSINIPNELLDSSEFSTKMKPHLKKIKVVIGYRNIQASKFSESLIRKGLRYVCSLHNGLEALRDDRLLSLPPSHH